MSAGDRKREVAKGAPGLRASAVAVVILCALVLIVVFLLRDVRPSAAIRAEAMRASESDSRVATSSAADDQPPFHDPASLVPTHPIADSVAQPPASPPGAMPLQSASAARVVEAVATCADSFEARNWEEYAACHEAIKAMFAALSEREQYELARSLSDDELKKLIRVIVSRMVPNSTFIAPMDHMDQYPAGLLEYMLEVAAGNHGTERMKLALSFFVACSDCPAVAFKPACEALKSAAEPDSMLKAIIQLSFAPDSIGEDELMNFIAAPGNVAHKGAALKTMAARGSPHVVDAVQTLMSSSNLEEVAAGVTGLQGLASDQPELLTDELTTKLVTAVDSVYRVLPQSQRRTVIIALLDLPRASTHLRTIATGESDPEIASHIEEIALDLDSGTSATAVRSKLIKKQK